MTGKSVWAALVTAVNCFIDGVAMTPKLALYLREYRTEREVISCKLEEELALDSLVFAYADGRPLDPSILSHNFARIARQAGLENVRFHDLRHTFASLMLLRGAKPKVISAALGHSSVAFTMDTYSHIIEGMQWRYSTKCCRKGSIANPSPNCRQFWACSGRKRVM